MSTRDEKRIYTFRALIIYCSPIQTTRAALQKILWSFRVQSFRVQSFHVRHAPYEILKSKILKTSVSLLPSPFRHTQTTGL